MNKHEHITTFGTAESCDSYQWYDPSLNVNRFSLTIKEGKFFYAMPMKPIMAAHYFEYVLLIAQAASYWMNGNKSEFISWFVFFYRSLRWEIWNVLKSWTIRDVLWQPRFFLSSIHIFRNSRTNCNKWTNLLTWKREKNEKRRVENCNRPCSSSSYLQIKETQLTTTSYQQTYARMLCLDFFSVYSHNFSFLMSCPTLEWILKNKWVFSKCIWVFMYIGKVVDSFFETKCHNLYTFSISLDIYHNFCNTQSQTLASTVHIWLFILSLCLHSQAIIFPFQ